MQFWAAKFRMWISQKFEKKSKILKENCPLMYFSFIILYNDHD